MNWQTFLNYLLGIAAAALPIVAVWFKLWMNAKIAELQARSDANTGRLDQHDKIQGVITSPTGAVNTTLGRTSLRERVIPPPSLNQPFVAADLEEHFASLPIHTTSDVLHETPDRLRVGVNDPHALANAVIEAQAGIQKP